MHRFLADLAERLKREGDVNVSAAVNVARGKGARTSVHRRQRVVQRNGETTISTHVDREEHEGDRPA